MDKYFYVLLAFYIWLLPIETDSKQVEGELTENGKNWVFLDRFCFLSDKGELVFEFTFPAEYEGQHLLLYYDEQTSQWPAVYKNKEKNCHQKEAMLKPERHQVIYLNIAQQFSGCILNTTIPSAHFYRCRNSRKFSSSRARWWYFVLADCDSNKNCTQRESPPHIRPTSNQMIVLSRQHYWSGCRLHNGTEYGIEMISCSASRGFKSARARWWYIALSNCAKQGLRLKYKLTMTNAPKGHTFFRQFSADEFYVLQTDIVFAALTSFIFILATVVAYILQTDIGFLVVLFCIFLLSCYVGVVLRSRQLFHTTYKMYIASLTLEVLHLFFMCIAYGKYAHDGKNNYGLKTFARTLEAASTLIFLLMLILMAKGYTITRGRLSAQGSTKIAIFMTLYTISYIALFIYEAEAFDPGLVLYIYESPAGYGLIAMRLIGWAWFCYAIFFTLKHYPEKSSFYYPYFLFYTAWFWAGPIVIFIAMSYMDLWVREKVVNGVSNTVVLLGHLFFLILTRPSAANSNFPFHVRTTQIGVMSGLPQSGAPPTASAGTDSFGMHLYAPTIEPPAYTTTPNFQSIFETARSIPVANGNTENFPHQKPAAGNPFIVSQSK